MSTRHETDKILNLTNDSTSKSIDSIVFSEHDHLPISLLDEYCTAQAGKNTVFPFKSDSETLEIDISQKDQKDQKESQVQKKESLSIENKQLLEKVFAYDKVKKKDMEGIFPENFTSIIRSHDGSILFQNNIDKLESELLNEIYELLKPEIVNLIMHCYANYFIQMLIVKLDVEQRSELMISMINSLDTLLKNMISFKAIACLLELPINLKCEKKIVEVLSSIDSKFYLEHTRYLKVLESSISSVSEVSLQPVFNKIFKETLLLLDLKQGYFLLRKLTKYLKLEENRKNLIVHIKPIFLDFIDKSYGLLLIKLFLKNFSYENRAENQGKKNKAKEAVSFNRKVFSKVKEKEQAEIKDGKYVNFPKKQLKKQKNTSLDILFDLIFSSFPAFGNCKNKFPSKNYKKCLDLLQDQATFLKYLNERLYNNKENLDKKIHIVYVLFRYYGKLDLVKKTFDRNNYKSAVELIRLLKTHKISKDMLFKKELNVLFSELEKNKILEEDSFSKCIIFI